MIWLANTLATLDGHDARFLVGMAAVLAVSLAAVVSLVLFSDSAALDRRATGLEDWKRRK
jgi:hypothetical protein